MLKTVPCVSYSFCRFSYNQQNFKDELSIEMKMHTKFEQVPLTTTFFSTNNIAKSPKSAGRTGTDNDLQGDCIDGKSCHMRKLM